VTARLLAAPILAGAILATAACERAKPASRTPPPPTVVTIAPSIEQVAVHREYPATSQSTQPVPIVPRVQGWIRSQGFVNGDMVKAGQVLYEIDPDPFQAKVDKAVADLAVAQAQLDNATQIYERNKPLLEADAISPEKLQDFEAQYLSAQANLKAAQAEVELARLNLSYCSVTSPVDGQASSTTQYVGALVGPDPFSPLVTVQPLDPLWVQFMAVSDDLPVLRAQFGQASPGVQIVLPTGTWSRSGRIVFIDNQVMPGSSMLSVRVEVPNPDHAVLPGTYLTARFQREVLADAVTVPIQAVVRQSAASVVWIVSAEGVATQKTVTLGPRAGDHVVIASGVAATDRVVVQGQSKLRNNQKVQVVTPDQFAKPAAPAAAPATPEKPEKPASSGRASRDPSGEASPSTQGSRRASRTIEADPIS